MGGRPAPGGERLIFKRGNVAWFKFLYEGKPVRESTRQGSLKVARQMEAARRAKLADDSRKRKEKAIELECTPNNLIRCAECEEWFNLQKAIVGGGGERVCSDECRREWIKRKTPIPTLSQFIDSRFEPWVKSRFEQTSPKTWFDYYRVGLRSIRAYQPLSELRISEINSEAVTAFVAHRRSNDLQISTINSSLRVLRRVLRVAVEWGALAVSPKIKMLPGERHRERVVSPEEEARYLAAAPEPVGSIVSVLIDSGLRPEECFRLRWESVTWSNGRHGTILVTHGKTQAARRVLPMTPRVKTILADRWERASKPTEGWIWPAPTRSGHIESSSIKKQHAKTFRTIAEEAVRNNHRPVRPFILYSLRHTFLTRLGESGCDVWTLARIAGHSSISMSSRYVHPSEDAVLSAMARLGGHKIGHSGIQPAMPAETLLHLRQS